MAEFLLGHFEIADELNEDVLRHCATKKQRAATLITMCRCHFANQQYQLSYECGARAIRQLGFDFPNKPSMEEALALAGRVGPALMELGIDVLDAMPTPTDEGALQAFEALSALIAPAYFGGDA